jgi:hypothetical protein
MPWSKVVTFTDPFPFQAALQSTSQAEVLPTTRGSFRVEATQIGMNKLRMQRFEVALPQIYTLMIAPDRKSIGFLIEGNSSNLQHCGLEVAPSDILVYGYDVLHQRSAPNFRFGTMSLPKADFPVLCKTLIGREFLEKPRTSKLRPDPALMTRLLTLHKIVGQLAHDTPDLLEQPEVRRSLEERLIHVMVRCLAEGVGVQTASGAHRHDSVIARFGNFWRQIATAPFISLKSVRPSALLSELFAPAVKSIWAWDQSGFSPCAECTSCGARSWAQSHLSQPLPAS